MIPRIMPSWQTPWLLRFRRWLCRHGIHQWIFVGNDDTFKIYRREIWFCERCGLHVNVDSGLP